jgi:hypothetical protein
MSEEYLERVRAYGDTEPYREALRKDRLHTYRAAPDCPEERCERS